MPLSAIEPRIGANTATNTPAYELARPSRAVLIVGSTPAFQNSLKNTGKKPAIIVVANAEFAQSYMHHPKIAFLSFSCIIARKRTLIRLIRRIDTDKNEKMNARDANDLMGANGCVSCAFCVKIATKNC